MNTKEWSVLKNSKTEIILLNVYNYLMIQAYKNDVWHVQLQTTNAIIYAEKNANTKAEAIKIINQFKNLNVQDTR